MFSQRAFILIALLQSMCIQQGRVQEVPPSSETSPKSLPLILSPDGAATWMKSEGRRLVSLPFTMTLTNRSGRDILFNDIGLALVPYITTPSHAERGCEPMPTKGGDSEGSIFLPYPIQAGKSTTISYDLENYDCQITDQDTKFELRIKLSHGIEGAGNTGFGNGVYTDIFSSKIVVMINPPCLHRLSMPASVPSSSR